MPNFPPTQEQQTVVDAVRIGMPKIIVNAGAGTGKSTQLEFCVEATPTSANKLYLVFNKSAETEAIARFEQYPNMQIKTVDAFAKWLVIGNGYYSPKNYRVQDISDVFNVAWKERKPIYDAINKYLNSGDIAPSGRYAKYVKEFFDKMDRDEIQKSFGYFMKKAHLGLANGSYSHKVENIYLAMIDEYQDTNGVSKAIFEYIPAKIHLKVGDKNQSIYKFRGAINSMERELKSDGVVSYPLTVSYRYTQEIADKANKILATYKGEKNLLTGKGKGGDIKTRAMLSRTNAKLIYGIDRLNKGGYKYNTLRKASEIFSVPITLAYMNMGNSLNAVKSWVQDNRPSMRYLVKEYEEYTKSKARQPFIEWLRLTSRDIEIMSALGILEDDKMSFDRLLELEQEADFYNQNYKNQVEFYLSTIHTSKGLEWDSVTVAQDMRNYPYLIAKHIYNTYGDIGVLEDGIDIFKKDYLEGIVDGNITEEFNLLYVAITRAKTNLTLPADVELLFDVGKTNKNINNAYQEIVKKVEQQEQSYNYKTGFDNHKDNSMSPIRMGDLALS